MLLVNTALSCPGSVREWHEAVAGYETTSQALTLVLQKLKQHPAVLEKLRAEQREVSGSAMNPDFQ